MLSFRFYGHGVERARASLHRRCSDAERALARRMEKDTRPFVPARTKSLMRRTEVQDQFVVYPGPYAMMLYSGKVMIDPVTGSAFARKGAKKKSISKALVFSSAAHALAQDHWFKASKRRNLREWTIFVRKVMARNGRE